MKITKYQGCELSISINLTEYDSRVLYKTLSKVSANVTFDMECRVNAIKMADAINKLFLAKDQN